LTDSTTNTPETPGLHTRLPPTPIASPGIPSLRAALNSADVTYLYYVLCSSKGEQRFNVRYAQFLYDKGACLGCSGAGRAGRRLHPDGGHHRVAGVAQPLA